MSLREYVTIGQAVEHELVVKKSRFICYLEPLATPEEAAAFLAVVKKKHHDARHNCSAVITGADRAYLHASDDGEPQGTAGIPMLEVLQKSGLTNLMAVVTRYFGGTLLGAGGLVRAYSASVAEAVKRARKVKYIPARTYTFHIAYADYGKLCSVAAEFGANVEGKFQENVDATVVVESTQAARFEERAKQAFLGMGVFEATDACYIIKEIEESWHGNQIHKGK